MSRLAAALLAAKTARPARIRAALEALVDVFGHPDMTLPLAMVTTRVAQAMKEPWSRALMREVAIAARWAGAGSFAIATRPFLRGVRWRGQSVAEAVAEGLEHRREARREGSRSGLRRDAQEEAERRDERTDGGDTAPDGASPPAPRR